MFFEKNSHFLKKYEINVDVKGTFSLYFFGGFCYKKKWTMKKVLINLKPSLKMNDSLYQNKVQTAIKMLELLLQTYQSLLDE